MALLRDVIMDRVQPYANHDLSRRNRFTASPGIGYPVLVQLVSPGDTFHIRHVGSVETYPMLAPLKGSFKLQLSYFFVPHRLYTQSMDVNRLNFSPQDVKFPTFNFPVYCVPNLYWSPGSLGYVTSGITQYPAVSSETRPVYQGTLLDYLGFGSQYGNVAILNAPSLGNNPTVPGVTSAFNATPTQALPRFDATPLIGYYDIMRNYFLNSQEPSFFIYSCNNSYPIAAPSVSWFNGRFAGFRCIPRPFALSDLDALIYYFVQNEGADFNMAWFSKLSDSTGNPTLLFNSVVGGQVPRIDSYGNTIWPNLVGLVDSGFLSAGKPNSEYVYQLPATGDSINNTWVDLATCDVRNHGCVAVTHRPDLFTAWLSKGAYDDMVSSSTINVANNQVTVNQIRMANHLLKYDERGLVAGGRYADWVYSQFGVSTNNKLCIPELLGVSSSALVFNEVVNQTTGESDIPTQSGLGGVSSKGQGFLNGYRQTCHFVESGYLIAIFTIIPNVSYSTNINPGFFKYEYGDLYAPELAKIGFQTLPIPWLIGNPFSVRGGYSVLPSLDSNITGAYYTVAGSGQGNSWSFGGANGPDLSQAIGYQPAWQEYMTAVDELHSDLANTGRLYYWSIARSFSGGLGWYNTAAFNGFRFNYTSYVLADQFSYAFADQAITAQNFICELSFDIVAKRQIGKRVMPSL